MCKLHTSDAIDAGLARAQTRMVVPVAICVTLLDTREGRVLRGQTQNAIDDVDEYRG